MKKYRNLHQLLFLSVIMIFPAVAKADATAHAIWGVGVQIGFAEVGANQGVSPNTLTQSLGYARDMAKQSGCIPSDELENLTVEMSRTNNSRTLYSRIAALRQNLSAIIQKNCRCAGGSNAAWAIWGAGVQIGYAEMASFLGISASQLAQTLTYARDFSAQTNCIDTGRIQELINAMSRTNNSRTLYQAITSYRQQQMFSDVQRNCSCSVSSGIPRVIKQCEGGICGTWTLVGSRHFDARWNNGAAATLTIKQFDKNRVIITRADTIQKGFTATYTGTISGNRIVNGKVVWKYQGRSTTGTWSANW